MFELHDRVDANGKNDGQVEIPLKREENMSAGIQESYPSSGPVHQEKKHLMKLAGLLPKMLLCTHCNVSQEIIIICLLFQLFCLCKNVF